MGKTARSILAALIVASLVGPRAAAEEETSAKKDVPLERDPAIERFVTLPNGFRYLIQPHDHPAQGVTLMLRVEVGSIHEKDDQRGFAHFVEHMAYNGTKHFPPGEVVRYFESLGMSVGLHASAFTYTDVTEYTLRLPHADKPSIERALLFFSDVAAAISFDAKEVEKEKAVIVEEARQRDNRLWLAWARHAMRGTRIPERPPLGDLDVVRGASPDALRAFHATWYRPERMTLIAVGRKTPVLEPLVRRAFAPLRATGKQPDEPDVGTPDPEPFAVTLEQDEVMASIALFGIQSARAARTRVGYRRDLEERVAVAAVTERMARLRRRGEMAFGRAVAHQGDDFPGFVVTTLSAQTAAYEWREGLHQLVVELARLKRHGLLPEEIAQAKKHVVEAYGAADRLDSERMVAWRSADLRRRRTPMSRAQHGALMKALLGTFTKRDLDGEVRRLFEKPRVHLLVPKADGVEVPTPDGVRTLVEKAWAASVAAPEAEAPPIQRLLDRDPAPGTVAKRARSERLGITTLTLGNGIPVHVKRLETSKRIHVHVTIYGGRIEEDDSSIGLTELCLVAFHPWGMATRRFSTFELSRWLAQRDIRLAPRTEPTHIALAMDTSADALEDGLRLLHILLTEPRITPESFRRVRDDVSERLWVLSTDTRGIGAGLLDMLMSKDDERLWLPDWQRVEKVTVERSGAWLRELVRRAPLEVAIVGDIEPARAEKLATRWFGSIAGRDDRTATLRERCSVEQASGPVRHRTTVETTERAAVVHMAWRAPGEITGEKIAALAHIALILDTRLARKVREEKGLTYDIRAASDEQVCAGMTRLLVRFSTSPARAEEAAALVQALCEQFAAKGPTREEIDTVSLKAAALVQAGSSIPQVWLQSLGSLRLKGRSLGDIEARLRAYRLANPERMRKLALEMIREEHLFQTIVVPK